LRLYVNDIYTILETFIVKTFYRHKDMFLILEYSLHISLSSD